MEMSQYMNEPVTKFRRLSFPFTLIHSVTHCVTLVQYCGEAGRLRGLNSKVQGYWGVGLKQPAMILRYNDNHKYIYIGSLFPFSYAV